MKKNDLNPQVLLIEKPGTRRGPWRLAWLLLAFLPLTGCHFERATGIGHVVRGENHLGWLGLEDLSPDQVTVTLETIESHFQRRMAREHAPNEMHWHWQQEAKRIGLEERMAAGHAVLTLSGRHRHTGTQHLRVLLLEALSCGELEWSDGNYQCSARLGIFRADPVRSTRVTFKLKSKPEWKILELQVLRLPSESSQLEIEMSERSMK